MRTFFIAGPPRSGTGWLSAFLTTDKSLCLHEGVKFGPYSTTFSKVGREICGDAGSHIQVNFKEILKEFPEAKFVIVSRDPEESRKSAENLGLEIPGEVFDENFKKLLEMSRSTKFLHIRFEDLFTLDACRSVWNHCIGTEFDYHRWEIFRRLNIQATTSTHAESLDFVTTGVTKQFH